MTDEARPGPRGGRPRHGSVRVRTLADGGRIFELRFRASDGGFGIKRVLQFPPSRAAKLVHVQAFQESGGSELRPY